MQMIMGSYESAFNTLSMVTDRWSDAAKAHLYKGLSSELLGRDATRSYDAMRQLTPSYCVKYFALKCNSRFWPFRMFKNSDLKSALGRQIQIFATLRVLMGVEYRQIGVGSNVMIPKDEAVRFPTTCFIKLPKMLEGYLLKIYQDMWTNLIMSGEIRYGDPQVPTRYGHANDMPSHVLLGHFNDMVTRVAGRLTKPTYTYFGGYKGTSVLHPHTDRLACEFTLTFQIYLSPERPLWPFRIDNRPIAVSPDQRGGSKFRPEPDHEVVIDLEPGDGGLIRGRKVNHFRDALLPNQTSYNIFFHFVWDDFAEDGFSK